MITLIKYKFASFMALKCCVWRYTWFLLYYYFNFIRVLTTQQAETFLWLLKIKLHTYSQVHLLVLLNVLCIYAGVLLQSHCSACELQWVHLPY